MLTRTNYVEWSIVMKVHLQAARLWEAVEMGDADHPDDRAALGIILCGVPPEMLRTLAAKDSAKEAGTPSRRFEWASSACASHGLR